MGKGKDSLTFESFLKSYVKSISFGNVLSMKKLLKEATTSNLRLIEPLILYIRMNRLEDTYAKFKNNDLFDEAMNRFALKYPDNSTLINEFKQNSVEDEFQKVYRSYLFFKNRKADESELKGKIITKTLELINTKKISKYRLSKELKINPGNLNSYLMHQKVDALSIQKCNSLLNYLVSL
jgi:hypothetical protein